ncbi:MAG: FAD-dependent oxidoreductase [Spirochaetes bacterium]|nr:FAD-dependent oxidoreductase [Spirochaetota bacterium]
MDTIKITIDGIEVESPEGKTILEIALKAGKYIPHLCHHPDLVPTGECKLCVVEVEGIDGFPTSCNTPAADGMIVKTKSPAIDDARKQAMDKILVGHPPDCSTCSKYLNCELQSVRQYLGIGERLSSDGRVRMYPVNDDNPLFVHDPSRCIVCERCVRACRDLRGVGILFKKQNGDEFYIGTEKGLSLAESGCRFCGACAEVCPTGAIRDKDELVKGKNRKTALIPCRYTCPAEIDVPRYVRFILEKNYSAATAVIREKVPFPKILGYVCNHVCETQCRRGAVNEPIAIRDLKRFAAENDKERLWENNSKKKDPTGKKVAVIGSGPAGLTAAFYLAKQGHTVTVFESLPMAGGMLRYGIPEYRLPRDIIDSEIQQVENFGVEIKTDTRIGSIDTLFENGYNAVIAAVGTHQGQKLPIPGADSDGVFIGIEFLRDLNLGKKINIGKNVFVLGGGNVAFDCARAAVRLGAEKVQLACLECREDMPASCEEIKEGEEEGIIVHPSKSFIKILNENGIIKGVEFLDVESFCINDFNEFELNTISDSAHVIDADCVIFAIGQKPEIPEAFGIDLSDKKLIEVDEYTFTTNREGVFAAGDAVIGPSFVIQAIASGRKAAMAVDSFLGGDGLIDEELAPSLEVKCEIGLIDGFGTLPRREGACQLPEQRLQGFCEVVESMDEEAANSESKRCLQCDLRLKITPVKFWGDY